MLTKIINSPAAEIRNKFKVQSSILSSTKLRRMEILLMRIMSIFIPLLWPTQPKAAADSTRSLEG
jgi:hypothetical protein